jgi:hypothetical protein
MTGVQFLASEVIILLTTIFRLVNKKKTIPMRNNGVGRG